MTFSIRLDSGEEDVARRTGGAPGRALTWLNVAAAALFVASGVAMAAGSTGLVDLAWAASVLAFPVLFLVEAVAGLVRCRRLGGRAFLPLATLLAAAAAAWALTAAGAALALRLRGSPHDPEVFLSGSRRQELTGVARRLLEQPPAGAEWSRLPADVARTLAGHGITGFQVDAGRRLVVLSYFLRRTRFAYVFMEGGLLERLPPPPRFEEGSIRDWGVLVDVVRGRSGPPEMQQDWTAGRSELERTLGREAFAALARHETAAEVTAEEKRLVVEALNGLVAPESRLSERFSAASLATAPPACGAWVDGLAGLLEREKVLRPGGPGRPPALAPDLGPGARRGVGWLHFGLVCSLYGGFGGLVPREPHLAGDDALDRALAATSRPLGDGWYAASD